ncbi:hypothetical protein EDB92DRAFT_1488351 [Lactarius akahatsu]|uniref:DUF6533 domain-containing protein n=1 Tax=Lactarius akahatsu TaxID=416441 RepID=A0AAD4LB35_9AGAM|nr:hypothetical protein EDB92DRAFT_1488351 [Lactarius akahatsu]
MEESLSLQLLTSGLDILNFGRYSLVAAYVVCFYDWIILLDQEVAFIYPAPWNVVKAAYLFCRYYPLVVAPFQFWGLVGDHEQRVCEAYYRVLFASTVPTILSAQFIMMLRTHAFSGRNKVVLAVLSIIILGLFSVIIWVVCKHLILSPLFIVVKRTSCFPISDQPNFVLVQGAGAVQGASLVQTLAQTPFAYYYHLGMISILIAFFDGLNMFILFRHCIRERGTFGPIGQNFLRQGVPVYVITTLLNMMTIGTTYSSRLLHEAKVVPWFAYILPSALSCRLVLMLRRKASPTETELRIEYSHMVNEALEMITVELHPEETSQDFLPSTSTYARAQPPPDVYHNRHKDWE